MLNWYLAPSKRSSKDYTSLVGTQDWLVGCLVDALNPNVVELNRLLHYTFVGGTELSALISLTPSAIQPSYPNS